MGVALLTTTRAVFNALAWPPVQLMEPSDDLAAHAAILAG